MWRQNGVKDLPKRTTFDYGVTFNSSWSSRSAASKAAFLSGTAQSSEWRIRMCDSSCLCISLQPSDKKLPVAIHIPYSFSPCTTSFLIDTDASDNPSRDSASVRKSCNVNLRFQAASSAISCSARFTALSSHFFASSKWPS